MATRASSVCAGRQRTERVRRVLPVPVAHQQCTTKRWSTRGKHLDRGREPDGKEKQPILAKEFRMQYGFILPHGDVHTLALIMLIQWSFPCLNAALV
jgi:hypothetical protein